MRNGQYLKAGGKLVYNFFASKKSVSTSAKHIGCGLHNYLSTRKLHPLPPNPSSLRNLVSVTHPPPPHSRYSDQKDIRCPQAY